MKNQLSMSMITSLVSILMLAGCSSPPGPNFNAGDELNRSIQLPPGSFQVDAAQLVETSDISIVSGGGSNQRMQVNPGSQYSATIGFNANSGVTHAGIRFGDNGQTWMVPVSGGQNATSGTIDLPFSIPSSLCDDLSSICHDIKCYEFAARETGSGQFRVSKSNINQLAMLCGDCDEPSCQSLLTNCNDGQISQGQCDAWINKLEDLFVKYEDGILNGDFASSCKFLKDYVKLLRSNDFQDCINSGYTGLSDSYWDQLITQYEDLINLLDC